MNIHQVPAKAAYRVRRAGIGSVRKTGFAILVGNGDLQTSIAALPKGCGTSKMTICYNHSIDNQEQVPGASMWTCNGFAPVT